MVKTNSTSLKNARVCLFLKTDLLVDRPYRKAVRKYLQLTELNIYPSIR